MYSDPQQPVRPPLPPPPQANWYPNQFQYQQQQQQPPQPNNQSIWPNNHSDHHQQQPISSSYPTPHPHTHVPPYSTHPPPQQSQTHYYRPPPPPYSHSQAYPPQPNANQAWGNPNWGHNQVWEHPDANNPNNNEDYWAVQARAWAAAKSSMDSQHQPSQFSQSSRMEEHNHGFQDQYQRTVDPHYANMQQPSLSASNHQQFSVPIGDPHRISTNQLQDSSSFSSVSSSYYASDLHAPYASRDGGLATESNLIYPHQGNTPTNSSGYQQEVPSSYSSVQGKGETSLLPISSGQEAQHHMQPTRTVSGRSVTEEQPYFTYTGASVSSVTDLSDRPLEFAPGFNRTHETNDPHPQSSYMHPDTTGSVGYADHVTTAPSISSAMPGMGYPPPGIQFDPSFSSAPMFGQIPGSNFRPNIPTGGPAFGVGAGSVLHPTTAYPGDPNGFTSVSDRPKKASVPNWLREEIIKNKAILASSSQDRHEEDLDDSIEEDKIEKSFVRRGLADSQGIDSSRSPEDEGDNEDGIEAARTAAINKEIKRVVTEVLLKVTDELFDEIATKVLNEDDLAVEVDHSQSNAPKNQKLLLSPPSLPAPKASAKVLIPVKAKEINSDDASGKSPSGSAGDLLGLGNYASDDDDDETENSSKSTKNRLDAAPLPASTKLSEDICDTIENGGSQAETKELSHQDQTGLAEAFNNPTTRGNGSRDYELEKNLNHEKVVVSITHKGGSVIHEGRVTADGENKIKADDLKSKNIVGGKSSMKSDLSRVDVGSKSLTDVSQPSQARSKSEMIQEQEIKRTYSSTDTVKEAGRGNRKVDSKHIGSGEPRSDERQSRNERTDDRNSMKDSVRDRSSKSGDKARESDSRKSSHSKDDKRENDKIRRESTKDDSGRKRAREKDEKEERLRPHGGRETSSHKRRHSPPGGGRVRSSKDNSSNSPANESSDEASEDSKQRKKHSRKHSLSPSPTRSRRRQVSRSPPSKHSHRRQSPYSSLENRRGRKSRSNSPVRRRR